MATPNIDPYLSLLRAGAVSIGSILTAFGVLSAIEVQTVMSALNDIGEGIKLIMRGGGVIVVVAATTWGMLNSKLSWKVSTVAAAAPAELAVAMTQVKPTEMVAAVNDMSGVKGVVTEDNKKGVALAASVPSSTVAPAGSVEALRIVQK